MTAATVVCSWGRGAAGRESEEVLTLGLKASGALGGALDWLVLGPLPDGAQDLAARYGVRQIDTIEAATPDGDEAGPDLLVAALAGYCGLTVPAVLLLSQTYDARLIAPRLAGRLESGVVMNGVDLAVDDGGGIEVTATAYGGDMRAVYTFGAARPCIVAVTPGAVEPAPLPVPAALPPVRAVALDLSGVTERISVTRPATAEGPRLEDARLVVAGGRGLGNAENFRLVERLAAALGGLPAASRAIVDDGWVGPALQIGLTGKITKPELYIAAGISGASQHMAGCSAAKAIVGINRDANASIFRYARYGIVGDSAEVLTELIRIAEAG